MRILHLKVNPSADQKRLRVFVEVSPFQKRPSVELKLTDPDGLPAGSVDIIETMNPKMELNMHLRDLVIAGEYVLEASLFYLNLPEPGHESPECLKRQVVHTLRQPVMIGG